MTKNAIRQATKGMWNNTRVVCGFNIARVCWFTNNQYMVIENEETFDEAKERTFVPIQGYRTQEELVNALYKVVNN